MLVVVTYDVDTTDIAGRRRLRRVAKVCAKFGQRVQNSVFECDVSPSDYLLLKHDLFEIMDNQADSLRFYNLGSKYSNKIEHKGIQHHLPTDSVMML
ncbi:CRISPR-associated endonuclease Cas2 [Alloscardovia venturai]|uniref:CRISPR-associated endoribonuclease Cas2 n=1 Tax=Alloscardovia venturai TaxID=1769421 RepID=A0ABW2Y821_9BIFI